MDFAVSSSGKKKICVKKKRRVSRRFCYVCTRLILIDRIILPLIANLIVEYIVKIISLLYMTYNAIYFLN